jgi:hypothetical protein
VVVIGMHRSGTSAVTGALGSLGLMTGRPDDRMDWAESNPEHWESLSLGLFNESLLHRLGGSWKGPPDLPRHWVHSASVLGGSEAGRTMASAYPEGGPSVWKDPRLCLLLPYWRTVLPGPLAAVFVWRTPLAVAHSLQRRDGLPLAVGLALWERYKHAALASLEGIDALAVDFDAVVADPSGFVDGCAGWLGSLDQFTVGEDRWDRQAATTSIIADLKHQPDQFMGADESLVTDSQWELLARLQELRGVHRPFHPGPRPVESPWTPAIIDAIRALDRQERVADDANHRFWSTRATLASVFVELRSVEQDLHNERLAREALQRARDLLVSQLEQARSDLDEAGQKLANLHHSTSWRITKPLRSSVAYIERRGGRRDGR